MNRAIPLLPFWAFIACFRANFIFYVYLLHARYAMGGNFTCQFCNISSKSVHVRTSEARAMLISGFSSSSL